MAVPVMMMPVSPDAQMQQVPCGYMPQMVPMPCCFVVAPEFCGEGMWMAPPSGCDAAWPQGAQKDRRRNGNKPSRNTAGSQQQQWSNQRWNQQEKNSDEPVTVDLTSLPKMLCNSACLEAAIEQAGLEKDVMDLQIDSANIGKATMVMKTERAAQRCINHFHGLRWARSSQPVSAKRRNCNALDAEDDKTTQCSSTSAHTTPASSPAVTPKMEPKRPPVKTASPKAKIGSCNSSPSMKPRWADYDSEDESDLTSLTDQLSTKSTQAETFDSSDSVKSEE